MREKDIIDSNESLFSRSAIKALKTVPHAKAFIARELQDMALGKEAYASGVPYMPPLSAQIWLAAAEMLIHSEENLTYSRSS